MLKDVSQIGQFRSFFIPTFYRYFFLRPLYMYVLYLKVSTRIALLQSYIKSYILFNLNIKIKAFRSRGHTVFNGSPLVIIIHC